MKISAMLSRRKGRDFYDVMFLLAQTQPDYYFFPKDLNIHNLEELKTRVSNTLESVDLKIKKREFEHLLFNKRNSERILSFGEFIQEL
jgi:predicted lipid carrier protein YhbT